MIHEADGTMVRDFSIVHEHKVPCQFYLRRSARATYVSDGGKGFLRGIVNDAADVCARMGKFTCYYFGASSLLNRLAPIKERIVNAAMQLGRVP